MKNGEPPSKLIYIKMSNSAEVPWGKDEKETYKGMKRLKIRKKKNQIKITYGRKSDICGVFIVPFV